MHIVGVPIKYKSKNGMSKQVGKSDVFTKIKLIELQDKMRTLCIASFNKEYGLNNVLKTKQKGRNKDINVKDMGNYIEMQEELSKNKERLEIANKKSLELDNNSNEVKDIVNNLKTTFTNKDKYILNKVDKVKIDKFIQQVDSTNDEYKKMQKLSINLNDVETELKENREKVKILTEKQKKFVYAEEADVLNVALFGITAKEWRENNPKLAEDGNMRNYTDLLHLVILNNLENSNAEFIKLGINQRERLIKLNESSRNQMEVLKNNSGIKELEILQKQINTTKHLIEIK